MMMRRIAKFILAEDIEDFKNEIRDLRDANRALQDEKSRLDRQNVSLAFDQEEYKFLKQLYELNGDPSADEKKKVKDYLAIKKENEELKNRLTTINQQFMLQQQNLSAQNFFNSIFQWR